MATSYTGLRVQDTYNAIIKIGDNSNLTATPKLLSDGLGNDSPLYLSGTRLGIGISPSYQFHTSGNAKIGGDVIISGDLTVNGDLTYLNVTDLAVEDPLIKLAKDNASNTLDIGFFGKYVESSTTKYTGLFWDASTDKFRLFEGLQDEPTTTVDPTGTGYTRSLLNANLEGNVTGTVSSLSNHDTNDLVEGSVNLYFTTNRARASFTAGTGVTITNGEIAIGQAVATTSNVTFANITGSAISGTTGTFSGNVTSGDTFILEKSDGKRWQQLFNGNNWNIRYYNGSSWSGDAIGIDTSNNVTFSGTATYNKIYTYYDGDYTSGFKFSDLNGGIWYDAGADDLYVNGNHANSQIILQSGGSTTLTLDSSQNATFAGSVDINGSEITVGTNNSIFAENNIRFKPSGAAYIDHNTVGQSFIFRTSASSSLDTTALTIASNGDSTFVGQVTIPETPTADAHAASKKYVDDNTGNADVAKRLEVTVKNVSGGSLAKGVVVHAAPTATPPSGNVIEVIAADANDAAKMPAIGVLNETIADEAEGEAVMFGAVSGIDTSGFSIADELYVSETAGEFTATKPTAFASQVQKIAVVIKSHASNGLIKVFGAGRSNDVPNRVNRDMNFTDDSELTFGDSSDLKIYHTTNNIVRINSGDLIFNSFTTDGDIKFNLDNGAGSLTEYIRLDGGDQRIFVSKLMRFGDDVQLRLGDNNDIRLYHNSTSGNGNIENHVGGLYITQYTDDGNIFFRSDDGSGGVVEYMRLDGGDQRVVYGRSIHMADNVSIYLGNSDDGFIKYDSTASKILYTGVSQFSSNLTAQTIHFDGVVNTGSPAGDATIGRNYAYDTLELKGYGGELMIGAQNTAININYRTCNNNTSGHTPTTWYWRAGSATSFSNHYFGLVEASTNVRAPIFYDSNNTAYYLNPAETSNLSAATFAGIITAKSSSSGDYVRLYGSSGTAQWDIYGNGENLRFSENSGGGGHVDIDTNLVVDGNVGIGTTSPARKFHVSNAANGNIALFTNTVDADLNINLTSGVTMLAPSTGIIALGTSNTERMRIDSSGQITNTMSGGKVLTDTNGFITSFQTLDTATAGGRYKGKSNRGLLGQMRIEQTATGADGGYITFDTSPNGSTTPTERMRIESDGTSILRGLVKINTGAQSSNPRLYFQHDNLNVNNFIEVDRGTGAMEFYNNGSERMRITSSGNVGIGTTSPAKKLEVATTGINQSTTVRIEGTDGNGNGHPLDLKMDGATDSFSILIGQGGGATPSTVLFNGNRNGNVGIGTTSPSSYYADKLVVVDGDEGGITIAGTGASQKQYICFADGTSGASPYTGHIAYDHDGDAMAFATNGGALAMYINSSQKVGIGTTSPLQPLHLLNGGFAYMRFTSQSYGATGFDIGQHTNGNIYLNNRDNTSMVFMTNNATALTINNSQNATFGGDVQAAGLYVGSTNTNFDFYNNGTSYFNGTVTVDANLYADALYDENNTGYYINPAGDSAMNQIHLADYIRHLGDLDTYIGFPSNDNFLIHTAGTDAVAVSSAGNLTAYGDVRTPIVYDTNNTARYLDPSGTSTSLVTSGKLFVQGGHSSGRVHINYQHSSTDVANSGALTAWVSEPGITYNCAGIGGNIHVNGQYYGRSYNSGYGCYVRFDKNNGNVEHWSTTGNAGVSGGQGTRRWYNDVSGNSFAQSSSRAPIFYDSQSTGYYLNPNDKSNLYSIKLDGFLSGTSVGCAEIGRNHAYNTMELKGYGAEFMIGAQSSTIHINYRTCNNGAIGHTPTTWYWRAGSSTSFSDHYFGKVTASDDVIAYSDKKLKTNIKTLDGTKVFKMRGVSFDRIDNNRKSSGVIAQELQEVAPELITECESDGTLGVAYGNLAGYLIEAIKGQQKIIEELKDRINKLEN